MITTLASRPSHALTSTILLALLASACPLLAAETPKAATDPFAGAFFPPELVLLARDRIGMTPEQRKVFRDCVEKTQLRGNELRAQLDCETAALATMAKQDQVDESALGAQLDRVLDVERKLKHLHLGVLLAIKKLLTPQQQGQLRTIAKNGTAQLVEDTRRRLTEKVERVTTGAQQWAQNGRDPSAILKAMNETVKPLLEGGKPMEAEVELDRILEQLKK
jgi:Spy/CpxP family protein refolding chaperone